MGGQLIYTLWTFGLSFLFYIMQFLPSRVCIMHFSIPLRWTIRNHLTMSDLPEIYKGQLAPFPDLGKKRAKYWWQLGGAIQF